MKKSTSPKIIPLGERILFAAPQTSADYKKEHIVGGIVIPSSASEETRRATQGVHIQVTVIAVGEGCKVVKPGQQIIILDRQSWNINCDGLREHQMVMEKDVMAVVK